jgi:hypothetical protein
METIVRKMQGLASPGGFIANYDVATQTLSVIGAEVRDGVTRPVCWAFAGPMSRDDAIARVRRELGLSAAEALAQVGG